MIRRRRVASALCAAVALVFVSLGAAARAQEAAPTVSGSVSGSLEKNQRAVFRIRGTAPSGGYQELYQLRVVLELNGVVLEELDYDEKAISITEPGTLPAQVGSTEIVEGRFFRVSGRDVDTATSGNSLTVTIRARVLASIPPGAKFRFVTITDDQSEASVVRPAGVEPSAGGFSWGTLGLAVLLALFVGGFVGNTFASRRRSTVRPSVYASLQRRIEEDKARR